MKDKRPAENDWWWPDPLSIGFWPSGVARKETLADFLAAYATSGFAVGVDATLEADIDKIAIYAIVGRPTHAARQLSNDRWTSKLGECEDIENELKDLVVKNYGAVEVILVRPVQTSPAA